MIETRILKRPNEDFLKFIFYRFRVPLSGRRPRLEIEDGWREVRNDGTEMDEFIESEIFEGELEKIIGVFRLTHTRGSKFIRDFEIFIEDCLDRIRRSPTEDILGIGDELGRDTENIGPRTEEIIRKRSSSVHRTYSAVSTSCPELGEA